MHFNELAGCFCGKKGLRQGDPIWPYLFAMAVEVLSKLLSAAADEGWLNCQPLYGKYHLTHLAFADLLIFLHGEKESL